MPTLVAEAPSPIVGADAKLTASLGIETLGGAFTPLITRGTPIPVETSETFSTATDHQRGIQVKLFRGDAPAVAANHRVAHFEVVGVSDAARGVPVVTITFSVTRDGIRVSAREEGNNALAIKLIEDR